MPDDENDDEMALRNQDRNYMGLDNSVSEVELEADKLGRSLNFKSTSKSEHDVLQVLQKRIKND